MATVQVVHGLVLERSQVVLVDKFSLACDASDVGLAVGEWPDMVLVWMDADHSQTMAFSGQVVNENGDRQYISTDDAVMLTILND